jgi:hypothetical protein
MYPYPQYFERTYVNPSGNPAASGYYLSHITQEIANKYPQWHAIRDVVGSVGQQFISPFAKTLHNLEREMDEDLDNSFISLAPVDEIDVLYRMKVPSTISFLENPNIECWTAPSGSTPSGYPFPEPSGSDPSTYNQIEALACTDLEEFYYYVIPTRVKAYAEEPYTDQRAEDIGISFPVKASGIRDPLNKYIDRAKKEHDLTWATDFTVLPQPVQNPILSFSGIGGGFQRVGGIFTAQSTGNVTTMHVGVISPAGALGQARAAIMSISGGTGTVLGWSDTTPVLPSTLGWYTFTFSTPVAVTASTNYILVVSIWSGGAIYLYSYPCTGKNVVNCDAPFYNITTNKTDYEALFWVPGFFSTQTDPGSFQYYLTDEPGEHFLKQDAESLETYESYKVGASGYPTGFTLYHDYLIWLGYNPDPSGRFLNISNYQPAPGSEYVDTIAVFDVTDIAPSGAPPSGVAVDEEGHIWILDEDRETLYALDAMYDYYLVDKENRFIYFREDYSDPGVFVKPA